jgi:DNA polymerase
VTYTVRLPERGTFAAWREAARRAIGHGIGPDEIDWRDATGGGDLFAAAPLPEAVGPHRAHVPPAFLEIAGRVVWHRAPERFALLYRALWRLDRGDADVLSPADTLGRRLGLMGQAVARDIHRLHAFVRFRELADELADAGPRRRFAAWFEPEHHTLEPASDFFVGRFADMDWLIATPLLTARFEAGRLDFGPGTARPDLPEDAAAPLWNTYFVSIFNPARLKPQAMRAGMPKRYWPNLPETRLIPALLATAGERVRRMHAAAATTPRPVAVSPPEALPESLEAAGRAAATCRRCNLCAAATGTVWGAGAADAALLIVGEQPGDREDLEGRPFVGPAGRLLRAAMAAAAVPAEKVWLTNAVKHFKFAPRGKQRLHRNPDRGEIRACRWWLGLEIGLVRPRLTLALGATAAFALTDDDGPLGRRRGGIETGLHGGRVLISWHPSRILRLADAAAAAATHDALTADLATAWRLATA